MFKQHMQLSLQLASELEDTELQWPVNSQSKA